MMESLKGRVLLLLPTTTYRSHDFVAAGLRLGIETVVGSDRKQILEDAAPGKTVTLTLSCPELAAEEISRFHRDHPLTAIVPTDEETVDVAARAAAALGLRHNPPEAARATRFKDLLRRKLAAAGVQTPGAATLPVDADSGASSRHRTYPCVLKPTFLSASRGVIRANGPAEFVLAFNRIRAILADPKVAERGGPAARHILVEEYVPGREVALEGMLIHGRLTTLALFDKPEPLVGPYFEETIYVTPSRLPADDQRNVERLVNRGARALGLVEGPVHAEVRLNGWGSWLIELAARSIGGLCSRTLQFGTGMSLEELILKHATGQPVGDIRRTGEASGVMMIPIPGSGTLLEVRGLEQAAGVHGITDITLSAVVGRPVVPLPEGSSYLGFIFARGEKPEAVEAALRESHRRLEFVIGDPE